jgi:hypothetical protein
MPHPRTSHFPATLLRADRGLLASIFGEIGFRFGFFWLYLASFGVVPVVIADKIGFDSGKSFSTASPRGFCHSLCDLGTKQKHRKP